MRSLALHRVRLRGFEPNRGASFVSNVQCVGEDFVPAGRRHTWTNLSSVLMDEEMPTEESPVEEDAENPGLTTIEEVFEISHCGRRAENPVSVHETLQPSPTNVSPEVQTMAAYLQSLAVALKNPQSVETPDVESRASVDSIPSEPSGSLRPLSSPTQDIFDVTRVSTTYYSEISDPIKPSTTSPTSPHPAEITRPTSPDSEILRELKQRQISLIPSTSFSFIIITRNTIFFYEFIPRKTNSSIIWKCFVEKCFRWNSSTCIVSHIDITTLRFPFSGRNLNSSH